MELWNIMLKDRLLRYWIYFKTGHGQYLTLFLSFMNFVVLQHRLFISQIPILASVFDRLSVFAIFFTIIYVPVSTFIGWAAFRKGPIKTNVALTAKVSPYIQDAQRAEILLAEALIDIVNDDKEIAKSKLSEVKNIRSKWIDRR